MLPPITECNNATALIAITNHRFHKKEMNYIISGENGGPLSRYGRYHRDAIHPRINARLQSD
jgi:hypothetical protein